MSVDTFNAIAVAGYALAIVFALAAVVVYFTKHVHEVHDELTGRTARAAIEQLRAGGVHRSAGALAVAGSGGPTAGEVGSGSLHVRKVEARRHHTSEVARRHTGVTGGHVAVATKATGPKPAAAPASEAMTTAFQPSQAQSTPDSEGMTTVFEAPASQPQGTSASEAMTTTLGGAQSPVPSEVMTALLGRMAGQSPSGEAPASEAMTTVFATPAGTGDTADGQDAGDAAHEDGARDEQ